MVISQSKAFFVVCFFAITLTFLNDDITVFHLELVEYNLTQANKCFLNRTTNMFILRLKVCKH